jgi:hypothetical protein
MCSTRFISPVPAGRLDPVEIRFPALPGIERPERRDDVLARAQQPADHVDVVDQRREMDAVGLEREDRLDIVGCGYADRFDPGDLARVPPHLLGIGHQHADQLIAGVLGEMADRDLADMPGGPLDDAIALLGHATGFPSDSFLYPISLDGNCPVAQAGTRGGDAIMSARASVT